MYQILFATNFSKKVSYVSFLGSDKSNLDYIRSQMSSSIKKYFFKKKNSPTIIKQRFIDHVNNNKLLGVYDINDEVLCKKDESIFYNKPNLWKNFMSYSKKHRRSDLAELEKQFKKLIKELKKIQLK